MASITTITQDEGRALYAAVQQTEVMLRQIWDGSGQTEAPGNPGRFSVEDIDAQITELQTALTPLA